MLFDALLPGEQPHVVIPGAAGSAIAGTGERILVIKSGARGGALLGARAKAFEYESVIGVRLDTETFPAVIAVDAPVKIATCRVYWADSRDNPWKARNAIPVDQPLQAAEAGGQRAPGPARGIPGPPPRLGRECPRSRRQGDGSAAADPPVDAPPRARAGRRGRRGARGRIGAARTPGPRRAVPALPGRAALGLAPTAPAAGPRRRAPPRVRRARNARSSDQRA